VFTKELTRKGCDFYDETSPHLYIVGVLIKYKNKNGMSKQVGKGDVFTRDSLRTIQDKMRTLCIASLNKEYGLNNILKKKEKGRNKDINVKDITNKDFKKTEMLLVTLNNVDTELQENREKIKILTENNKALSLKVDTLSKNIDNKTKEIKELKQDNKHLQEMVDYFKHLFSRLVKFIKK